MPRLGRRLVCASVASARRRGRREKKGGDQPVRVEIYERKEKGGGGFSLLLGVAGKAASRVHFELRRGGRVKPSTRAEKAKGKKNGAFTFHFNFSRGEKEHLSLGEKVKGGRSVPY